MYVTVSVSHLKAHLFHSIAVKAKIAGDTKSLQFSDIAAAYSYEVKQDCETAEIRGGMYP